MAADTADAADAAALLEQLSVEGPTTLETLPDELHPLILQFLEARGLVHAAGVCRTWQRHAERIALQKMKAPFKTTRYHAWPFEELPPSRLRALVAHDAVIQTFGFPENAETVLHSWSSRAVSAWRLLRIEQVMRMAHADRQEILRTHILEHMTPDSFVGTRISAGAERRRMDPQVQWMMEHGWHDEDAVNVALFSYGGSYAVAAAFRNERSMCAFALTSSDTRVHSLASVMASDIRLPSLLQQVCYRLWVSFSFYAWSAEEQHDPDPDEPDIPEAQIHNAESADARIYPAPDAFASLSGEFGLAEEDPAWLNLEQADPGFVFDSRCISVCMAANNLNFPDGVGFRTPVRIDGVVEYLVRLSPVVRFVSAPRDRSGCHSLIPVDHDTFRVPPLARITLERIDEPGEWSANGLVIRQRCYTVSLSYG